jgi:hypothetical protein
MSGNCRAYVNADGITVTDTITYRAFGEEIAGNVPTAKQSHYGALYGYWHNQMGAAGIGAGRNYARERWMDPTKCVWLNRDGQGFAIAGTALADATMLRATLRRLVSMINTNTYRYAYNSPTSFADPMGDNPILAKEAIRPSPLVAAPSPEGKKKQPCNPVAFQNKCCHSCPIPGGNCPTCCQQMCSDNCGESTEQDCEQACAYLNHIVG